MKLKTNGISLHGAARQVSPLDGIFALLDQHQLTELSNQRMATIPASPVIGQNRTSKFCQAKGIIKFTEGKQSGIGGDLGAVEFELQATVFITKTLGHMGNPGSEHHANGKVDVGRT